MYYEFAGAYGTGDRFSGAPTLRSARAFKIFNGVCRVYIADREKGVSARENDGILLLNVGYNIQNIARQLVLIFFRIVSPILLRISFK